MAELQVPAARCVVIEDSAAGIASGLAAGVAVLGVPAMQAVDPAPGLTLRADLVGVDVAALEELLSAGDLTESVA
jgi:beta-phosphoglucomutase-like phosphatase (HAD superfamily)